MTAWRVGEQVVGLASKNAHATRPGAHWTCGEWHRTCGAPGDVADHTNTGGSRERDSVGRESAGEGQKGDVLALQPGFNYSVNKDRQTLISYTETKLTRMIVLAGSPGLSAKPLPPGGIL